MAVTQITDDQLRAFLATQGWDAVSHDDVGDSWVLPGAAEAPAILVPRAKEGSSYRSLIGSALSRLSWVTGLPEQELLERINGSLTETFEVSVLDPTTQFGRIQLERGAQLAETLRVVIMNGARLHFAGGRIAHQGGLSAAARDVVKRLELAPPSEGSFRLTVQAPVYKQLALEGADAPTDAVHSTLVSALRAVDATRETVEADIPGDPDSLDDAVSRGVSTNLVRAVRKLDTQSSALRVEFRARWSQDEAATPSVVALEARHFSRLARLERVLSRFDPRSDVSVQGWIKEVIADALAVDAPLAGVVVVETQMEGRRRDVRVELSGDDLRRAGAGIGQRFLHARGTLERVGRYWYLSAPRDITIR